MGNHRLPGPAGKRQRLLQKILNESTTPHQRSDWRQTEYQRPRFSCCHFGSEQSFFRIAAEAVGSEGGGGVELEHAARATISAARIPSLTSVPLFLFATDARDSR